MLAFFVSLEKCLFKFSAYFFNWIACNWITWVLYFFLTVNPYQTYDLQIFFPIQSVGYFFILLMISFAVINLSSLIWTHLLIFAFLKKSFYWSIVYLQYCINFSCIAKWLLYTHTHTHTHTHTLFWILFHYGLSRYLIYFPMLYSRTPLVIHSKYNSSHLLIPNFLLLPCFWYQMKKKSSPILLPIYLLGVLWLKVLY